MQLKTKGRLAVTAMIDLALRCAAQPVALAAISRRQGISMSYLEQLFGTLRRHELVESTRGPGGGYRLCRPADEISVAEIVAAVDGVLEEADVADTPANAGELAQVTRTLWAGLNASMIGFLESVTLKSLVDEQLASGVAIEQRPGRRAIASRPAPTPPRRSTPNSIFALADALSDSARR